MSIKLTTQSHILYNTIMKLIIGLGNPEAKYTNTRHNIGFGVLDALATGLSLKWQKSSKFRAQIIETTSDTDKIILAKPETYYNLVGESVRSIMDFFKITPTDILIIHDDIDIPIGSFRTRVGGSDAGNNGLKSLNQHIGPNTHRLRIGIGDQLVSGVDKVSIVLGQLSSTEQKKLSNLMPDILETIDKFTKNQFEATTISLDAEQTQDKINQKHRAN